MSKFLRNLIGWVLYIAVLIGLIYGIPKAMSFALGTPYPMASITSGSMWPVLKKGDLVLIKGINGKEEIKIGDIVVYRNPSITSEGTPSTISEQVPNFTIHRVVEISDDTIRTKGDANNAYDTPVRFDEVIGKTLTFNGKPIKVPLLGNASVLVNRNKIEKE